MMVLGMTLAVAAALFAEVVNVASASKQALRGIHRMLPMKLL